MLRYSPAAMLGLLAVCALPAAAQPPRPDAFGQSMAIVRLSLNQDVEVESNGTRVRVRLTDIRDSRCPSDVMCIRAGEAVVTVDVTPLAPGQAGQAATATLMLPGQPQTAAGVRLTLTAVEPYPKASQPTPPQQRVATISVVK